MYIFAAQQQGYATTSCSSHKQSYSWKSEPLTNEFSLLTDEKINSAPFRFIQPFLKHFSERVNNNNTTNINNNNMEHVGGFKEPIPVQYLNELSFSMMMEKNIMADDSEWFEKLKFVDQDFIMANVVPEKLEEGFWYERHIYETSQIPTRFNNLHDFYGYLIWMTFPRTKRLFNLLHNQNMLERDNTHCKKRSPTQNFLTLFDECGVLVCIEENYFEELKSLLVNMEFKELFWNKRDSVKENMLFINFGHSILEMLTMRPYIGYTTKFIAVPVNSETFRTIHSNITNSPSKEIDQLVECWKILDNITMDLFQNQECNIDIQNTKSLRPLPILGIPNWWPNQNEEFYNNQQYFRSKPAEVNI